MSHVENNGSEIIILLSNIIIDSPREQGDRKITVPIGDAGFGSLRKKSSLQK
jgi:hypothetical protein